MATCSNHGTPSGLVMLTILFYFIAEKQSTSLENTLDTSATVDEER